MLLVFIDYLHQAGVPSAVQSFRHRKISNKQTSLEFRLCTKMYLSFLKMFFHFEACCSYISEKKDNKEELNPENWQVSSLKSWEFRILSEMNESNLFVVYFEREVKVWSYSRVFMQCDKKLLGKEQTLPI